MAKTLNLQLNLEENGETKFEIWRKSIDGNNLDSEKSNMQILDEVIGEIQKALKLSSSNLDKYKSEVAERIQNTNANIDLVKQNYTTKIDFDNKVEEINSTKASKEEVNDAFLQSKNYTDESVQTILGEDIEGVYETIKEIQDLLESDVSQTGNILENISKNKEDIANLKNADISINERITTETNNRVSSVNNLTERIENEENARQNSDASISNRINEVVESIKNETTERENSDKIINNQIGNIIITLNNKANVGELEEIEEELNEKIDNETNNRQNADNAINQEIGGIKNTLNEKADKTELDGKLDKTEFEEKTSEAVGLIQGDINHLSGRVDVLESELDEKADKSELDNKVNKEDLAPIILTPSSTFDECYNAFIQGVNGRMVIYEVGNGVGVIVAVVDDGGSETKPIIAGGYYNKDGKVYYCGVKLYTELRTVEHFNEEVTTNTGSGQIIIEVKNITVEDSEDFELLGTGTITAEQSQQIIDNFSNTVLFSQEWGVYAYPSMMVDGGYVYKAQVVFISWNSVVTLLVDTATNVVTAFVPREEERIIELTNIEETGEDAYTATISLDEYDLITSNFESTKLRFVLGDTECTLTPCGKEQDKSGIDIFGYSTVMSATTIVAGVINTNGNCRVLIYRENLVTTDDLKQQNVINENTFASKDYVDEKIEQIETVKGDKGDKGDTGRGIASIMQSGATFIVIYTDGTRQEIVMEQDYQFNWQVEENGLKVEGILPPEFELEITEDFDGMELTGVAVGGFYGQGGLVKVTIAVPHISQEAFYDCETLNDVTLTNKVTGIGENAFGGSTPAGTSNSPIKVTYPHIQYNVTINRFAFGYNSDGSPRKGYFIDQTGDIGEWDGERINWNY